MCSIQEPSGTFKTPKKYLFATESYILKCGPGFVYPADSLEKKQGQQTLVCNGTTHKYDDPIAKKEGASVTPCEESKGCPAIKQVFFLVFHDNL